MSEQSPKGYGAEHFSKPTPETLELFNATFETLRHLTEHIGTIRNEHLTALVGDTSAPGYYADIFCGIYEHTPVRIKDRKRASLSVSIAQRNNLPTRNPTEISSMQLPRKRTFMHGQVYHQLSGGGSPLSDDEFNMAMAHLQLTLPDGQWEWIDKARRLAGTQQDPDFLPFLIQNLLDTTPFAQQVSKGKEQYMSNVQFKNGAVITYAKWIEANTAYLWEHSDVLPVRAIDLLMPTGEKYSYETYTDGTTQMAAETNDTAARARLTAEGFPAIEKDTLLSPEERQLGLRALSDPTMRRFTDLLHTTLDSGVTTLH